MAANSSEGLLAEGQQHRRIAPEALKQLVLLIMWFVITTLGLLGLVSSKTPRFLRYSTLIERVQEELPQITFRHVSLAAS